MLGERKDVEKEGEGTTNERLMWRSREEDGGWRGEEMLGVKGRGGEGKKGFLQEGIH